MRIHPRLLEKDRALRRGGPSAAGERRSARCRGSLFPRGVGAKQTESGTRTVRPPSTAIVPAIAGRGGILFVVARYRVGQGSRVEGVKVDPRGPESLGKCSGAAGKDRFSVDQSLDGGKRESLVQRWQEDCVAVSVCRVEIILGSWPSKLDIMFDPQALHQRAQLTRVFAQSDRRLDRCGGVARRSRALLSAPTPGLPPRSSRLDRLCPHTTIADPGSR